MDDKHGDHRDDIVRDDMQRALCRRRDALYSEEKEGETVNYGKQRNSGIRHK